MMNDHKVKLIKIKVLIAQGDNELRSAKNEISSGNFGKVRVLSRRASGFYLSALDEMYPELKIGSNFITQLRKFGSLNNLDEKVKQACNQLSARVHDYEINAGTAIKNAEIIIDFVQAKLQNENKN